MTTLTLDQAAAKVDVEKKKLAGRVLRNDFDDPIWVDKNDAGEALVADDWRLERLANT